ncbi:Phage portal protein [Rhodovulum sp. PH10]|uniref:phage portal protein n=1 Tax=Rhodovulum sp. PH10 TaxID=1187851 RepID=UPI00027C24B5|nr:phage portal protein [Rhodovulum sp. PH10]EJW12743.1 Phage portal protein [Rhodovulum sp. PH10]
MGLLDAFRRRGGPTVQASAIGDGHLFGGLGDPLLLEFIRSGGGGPTQAGIHVTPAVALKNPTVIRCVSLISFAIGMLPLHLIDRATKEKATAHPLFRALHRRPNPWQTAYEFRALMQQRALGASGSGDRGDAFALIVRSRGRVMHLVPLPTERVRPRQRADWMVEYEYTRPDGGKVVYAPEEVFHLRYGLSSDGISGLSLVKQAAEAIALAVQSERAAARMFVNGMIAGGFIKHPGRLSADAQKNLAESMAAKWAGVENAHKWPILEEGMDAVKVTQTAEEAQHLEMRKMQIEEIARPFGVPRPLLGVDDTSWGSGIDVLGQFFVRYALGPWFEAWQQAAERSLLTDAEIERYEIKFNAGALLRGSMAQQADFFAKALGAGGHSPWMGADEVRELQDLPPRSDLPPPAGVQQTRGSNNEPAQAA